MPHLKLYQQFIAKVRQGVNLLGDGQQAEVAAFVRQSQHLTGGYTDRAGAPDLYYSVFGSWLAEAIELKDSLSKLNSWLEKQKLDDQKNSVNRFSLLFLQLIRWGKRLSAYSLAQKLMMRDFPVNFTYQMFLVLLLVDASYGQKAWIRFLGRWMLRFYSLPKEVPSSVIAALMVARSSLGLKSSKLAAELLGDFQKEGAFVAFRDMNDPDLLSTGVALFALLKSGEDLRAIAPDSLAFIQQNYRDGAFVAGDDDPQPDLEYTFYGLLALGSLAEVFGDKSSE